MGKEKLISSIAFIFVGSIFFIVGCIIFLIALNTRMTTIEANSIMIGAEYSGRYYTPIVQYQNSENVLVTAKSITSIRHDLGSYEVGDSFTVRYNPETPNQVKIGNDGELFCAPPFFTMFGLVFIVIGGVRLGKKEKK
jgi:hypothetical protein